ncbi:MAG TPA: AI-2E family transporter [Anaerolineales bacterium]
MLIEPPPPPPPASPRWGQTTKLVVGLTTAGLVTALIINFRSIIGPLILAFILAYLLHPVAITFSRVSRLPWRTAVTLIYLLLIAFILGLFTLTGLAILQQIQSLIGFVTDFIPNLQSLIGNLSTSSYRIGPFLLDFSHLNLQLITDQLLAAVQPLLGRLTTLLSGFATGAGATLGWTAS